MCEVLPIYGFDERNNLVKRGNLDLSFLKIVSNIEISNLTIKSEPCEPIKSFRIVIDNDAIQQIDIRGIKTDKNTKKDIIEGKYIAVINTAVLPENLMEIGNIHPLTNAYSKIPININAETSYKLELIIVFKDKTEQKLYISYEWEKERWRTWFSESDNKQKKVYVGIDIKNNDYGKRKVLKLEKF